MKKLIRKFLSKFKHWHRFQPNRYESGWIAKCECGSMSVMYLEEKKVKEIVWKSNVHSGNLRANYINNGVLQKGDLSQGIKP